MDPIESLDYFKMTDFGLALKNGLILFIEVPGAQEKQNLRFAEVCFFAPENSFLSELK